MFPIERGRYENIARENRICKLCNTGIGDEEHYFMICSHPLFTEIRSKFKSELYNVNRNISLLPDNCMFKYLVSCKDKNIIFIVGKYVHSIMKTYKENSNR